ncbi:GNAT family N-acetyltransferase [Desulfobacter vibrioformis]|uniref:GNAT family N-acetyltransferase n=1 Tax=Desulfobacter vibrioformis TaxID=34031 RepID=UPI000555717B|nr:GNAT family N-acetyltransferase [Desulfobacter vibrioformis]
MYEYCLLNRDLLPLFQKMTYPVYWKMIKNFPDTDDMDVVAYGCMCFGVAAGLAIAFLNHVEKKARLLSLFTDPEHRNRGIAATLLSKLNENLKDRHVKEVYTVFERGRNFSDQVENSLKKCGFSDFKIRAHIGRGHLELMRKAAWWQKAFPLTRFSIIPWKDISREKKQRLRCPENETPWYPPNLSPFNDPHIREPLNSFGLIYQSEIAGWSITHRIAPDTIRYTCLFVREEFQAYGIAIPLIAASIKKHIEFREELGLGKFTFVVYPENGNMLRFVNRYFRPYLDQLNESVAARKVFIQ